MIFTSLHFGHFHYLKDDLEISQKSSILDIFRDVGMQEHVLYPLPQAMSAAANYAWVNRSSMTFLTRQAFAKAQRWMVNRGFAPTYPSIHPSIYLILSDLIKSNLI